MTDDTATDSPEDELSKYVIGQLVGRCLGCRHDFDAQPICGGCGAIAPDDHWDGSI